jgi:hypothetical protein
VTLGHEPDDLVDLLSLMARRARSDGDPPLVRCPVVRAWSRRAGTVKSGTSGLGWLDPTCASRLDCSTWTGSAVEAATVDSINHGLDLAVSPFGSRQHG